MTPEAKTKKTLRMLCKAKGVTAVALRPATAMLGWPDYTLFKDGRVAFIEIKSDTPKMTGAHVQRQRDCHTYIRETLCCDVCFAIGDKGVYGAVTEWLATNRFSKTEYR